jgi:UDP-galactopyranose mutase
MKRIAIVGTGLAGAVIARELEKSGIATLVVDERTHIGGIWATARDARSGSRTLDFELGQAGADFQGTAVMNCPAGEVAFMRIVEHRHFTLREANSLPEPVYFREYSRACLPGDFPCYPIRLALDTVRDWLAAQLVRL